MAIPMRPKTGCPEIDSYQGPIIGADEVGWGCCAGPLVIGACCAPPGWYDPEVKDSKQVRETTRNRLYQEYWPNDWPKTIITMAPGVIDDLRPGPARKAAFKEAIRTLIPQVRARWGAPLIVVDGDLKGFENSDCWTVSLPKADCLVPEVSLASIFAKVWRDRKMVELHQQYPHYNWEKNKGYPTPDHLETLMMLGPTPLHRRSYSPVAKAEQKIRWSQVEQLGLA
jgi:ribonuclease HII